MNTGLVIILPILELDIFLIAAGGGPAIHFDATVLLLVEGASQIETTSISTSTWHHSIKAPQHFDTRHTLVISRCMITGNNSY